MARNFVITEERHGVVHRLYDVEEAVALAETRELSKSMGATLALHCDSSSAGAIYTAFSDGNVYRHASGSKRGFVKLDSFA